MTLPLACLQAWTSERNDGLPEPKRRQKFKISRGPREKMRRSGAKRVRVGSTLLRSGPPPQVGRKTTGFEREADARISREEVSVSGTRTPRALLWTSPCLQIARTDTLQRILDDERLGMSDHHRCNECRDNEERHGDRPESDEKQLWPPKAAERFSDVQRC